MSKQNNPTVQEILKQLKALGDESVRKQNTKQGAGDNQYGVRLGEIRKLAKKIKTNHDLALELWKTKNIDARFLAVLIMEPGKLSKQDMEKLVTSTTFSRVADWLNSYVVKNHPDKEILRQKWMKSKNPMAGRSGWDLTRQRVAKNAEGLDLPKLLDRIEVEMPDAGPLVQWTMNWTLVEIGIYFSKHRKRAVAIGEKIGLYRDYPTQKGCTSPFAPLWINEMARRQKAASGK